ncbi:SRPBCC domain-containing protein, partial [Mangrovicoccus algicola]
PRRRPAPGLTRGLPDAPLEGATTLQRTVAIARPAAEVWAVLGDIRRVADCLPGASVETIEGDIVSGAFATRIGPMTARFTGTARVRHDAAAMTGHVAGAGGDSGSRSGARGEIGFALHPEGDAACRLDSRIAYRLTGPLAQLGRPAIVAGIVDRMLQDFAANVAAAAAGTPSPGRRAPGAFGLIMAALRPIFRRKRDGGSP